MSVKNLDASECLRSDVQARLHKRRLELAGDDAVVIRMSTFSPKMADAVKGEALNVPAMCLADFHPSITVTSFRTRHSAEHFCTSYSAQARCHLRAPSARACRARGQHIVPGARNRGSLAGGNDDPASPAPMPCHSPTSLPRSRTREHRFQKPRGRPSDRDGSTRDRRRENFRHVGSQPSRCTRLANTARHLGSQFILHPPRPLRATATGCRAARRATAHQVRVTLDGYRFRPIRPAVARRDP